MNLILRASLLCCLSGVCAEPVLSRIAFGSCAQQNQKQEIWEDILAWKPELFLFLGDNIYGDTEDEKILREKYQLLAQQPGYMRLKEACPVLAVWDDHDYGKNDAGVEFPAKSMTKRVFLEFFEEPKESVRWERPGTYHSVILGPVGKRVQIIMLDTRWFRSALEKLPEKSRHGPYAPTKDTRKTILGEAQWSWLEKVLQEPAEVRLVMSSIQLVSSDHHWETWGNFPHERARFYRTLRESGAGGVLVLSGDRHRGEISCDTTPSEGPYPIYDITSSGLTWSGGGMSDEPNRFRVGAPVQKRNFGGLTIDWDARPVMLEISLHQQDTGAVVLKTMDLDSLQPTGR